MEHLLTGQRQFWTGKSSRDAMAARINSPNAATPFAAADAPGTRRANGAPPRFSRE
jgi:hypothetical protein